MEFKDYYKIMGVSRDATQDEIKRAYRKLARKYHPDVSKEADAEAKFKAVGEAYEVLKDPEKRAAYEQLYDQRRTGEEFRPPPGWERGFEFSGGGFTDTDASRFSDFFEFFFGRPSRYTRTDFRMRGEDLRYKIRISLEDAYHGAMRAITLRQPEVDAKGHVRERTRTLSVRIPKGVIQGQQIRLTGQGAPGTGKGTEPGDLYLEVEFEPHPVFRVDGQDVYLDLPMTPWEAALGARVPIPTLGGKVEMTIPAGSQSGRKLRLKGRGLPGNPRGDQYVVLRIETPPADTEAAKAFYRKMAEEFLFTPRAEQDG